MSATHLPPLSISTAAWAWRFEYKIQDMWIGAYWDSVRDDRGISSFDLWICFLPCVPLHVAWERRKDEQP